MADLGKSFYKNYTLILVSNSFDMAWRVLRVHEWRAALVRKEH